MASPPSSTIAFVSDARPSYATSNANLTDDFDQLIPQSPNGKVDAVVMVGDMDPINSGSINTVAAYSSSTAKNIPSFFVVGNHELDNTADLPDIKSKFLSYSYYPKKGPAGTSDTTYSFDTGDIHVIVLNEYWDGDNNGVCAWYPRTGNINTDDSCMKYSGNDGGYIPDTLFAWLQNDLSTNKKNWTVVTGHEVLYPHDTNHAGDSLDEDTTNRDRLQNLFISKNVTAFVGGHTHQASLTTIGNVIHADAGVMGVMAGRGGPNDNFATIIYANVNESGYFTITKVSENPTWSTPVKQTLTKVPKTQLSVISPNSGEILARGTTKAILWTSAGIPGTNVKIELLKGRVPSIINSSTPNDGSYSWIIPSTQSIGSNYKVRVTSTNNSAYTDTSNNNFIISTGITIVSPNGRENWARGTTKTINWTSSDSSGTNVKIELLKDGVLPRIISSNTPNDGSHSWTIPLTQTIGNNYKVRVTSTTNSAYTDTSNNNFTISI